jgi:hypothetical protein
MSMVLTLTRSAPQMKVPSPGEPPTPIVPDAPVVPADPDPVTTPSPAPPSVPQPDPERDVPIEPPDAPQTV